MFYQLYFLIFFPFTLADFTFLSMADWGGKNAPAYTKEAQCDAGSAMEQIAAKYNVDTILAVGDNFYSYGVTADDADAYFSNTFDKVYTGPTLNQAKFYAVAGNHDHRGDVEAQINYPLEKWVFPDNWYTFTKDLGNGMTAQWIMIDTVLLVGESYHDIEQNIFVAATGPKNLQRAQSQWTFIEQELSQSDADFLFVAGHYPVYAHCSHGSTKDLVTYLKPLLEQYDVTAYIAGHDHCASYVDEGTGPVYPMNGMADECCYKGNKLKKLQKLVSKDSIKFAISSSNRRDYGSPTAGFNSYTLKDSGEMKTRVHDQDGNVIFEAISQSRRVSSQLQASNTLLNIPTSDVSTFALLTFSACILGFFSTYCWIRQCRKPSINTDIPLHDDLLA